MTLILNYFIFSGPPSAYAISGLYGDRGHHQQGRPLTDKKVVSRRRTHSGSLGLASNLEGHNAPVTNNPSAPSVSSVKTGNEPTSGHPAGTGVLPNGSALVQADHVLLSKSNSCATTSNTTNSGKLCLTGFVVLGSFKPLTSFSISIPG